VTTSHASRPLLFAIIAGILGLTLFPTGSTGGIDPLTLLERVASRRAFADSIVNVLLFLPLGAALALNRRGWWIPIGLGAALSAGIEIAQLFIPGRYSSPWDLGTNTLGAALGVAAVRLAPTWLCPGPRLRRTLAGGSAVAALITLLGGSMLFHPAPRDGQLIGQWNHRFENRPHYSGRVLEATVAGLPTPPWEVRRSPEVLTHLFTGPVHIRFEAGRPPQGGAPLFALVAPHQQTLFAVDVSGHDLVISYRMRARPMGFDQPEIHLTSALAHVRPGDTVSLRYRREGPRHCVALNGEEQCDAGYSAAHTWSLLMYPVAAPVAAILPFLWVAALVFPTAFWSGRFITAVVQAAVVAAALGVAPLVAPVLPPTWPELLAAAAGAAAGYSCGRWGGAPLRGGRKPGKTATAAGVELHPVRR
jgi:hypothetical protein